MMQIIRDVPQLNLMISIEKMELNAAAVGQAWFKTPSSAWPKVYLGMYKAGFEDLRLNQLKIVSMDFQATLSVDAIWMKNECGFGLYDPTASRENKPHGTWWE